MSHPLLEIRFEDLRGEFPNVTKNWYHVPRVGEVVEFDEPRFVGRVVSVGWIDKPDAAEYVVVRVK